MKALYAVDRWVSLLWNVINREIRKCRESSSDSYKVIDCLKALVDKYGRDGMIFYEIAMQYEALGLYDKAMEYCREAVELFPLPKYKSMARECYRRNAERVGHGRSIGTEVVGFRDVLVIDDDTLFVVNCTKLKVWDIARELGFKVLRKMPAALAYHGRSFYEFLILIRELNKSIGRNIPWVILSAKYGFLAPNEVIENYDVTFDQPESISDEELAEQVEFKEVNGRKLSSFKRVYVYTRNPLYYEKACKALRNADVCVQISSIQLFPCICVRKPHN